MIAVLIIGLTSCIKDSEIPDSPVDLTLAKEIAELQKMTFAIFLEIDDVIRNEDTLDFDGPGADPTSCVKGNLLQSGYEIYE